MYLKGIKTMITIKEYNKYSQISLENRHGIKINLLNYGATVKDFLIPGRKSPLDNIVLSLESPEYYNLERTYLGATVGRVIGRIKNGVWLDGKAIHNFDLNDGVNHAHGGFNGLDTQVYNYEIEDNIDCSKVYFHLIDPDGHNNYPGNLEMSVIYTLDQNDTLSYEIKATTDKKNIFNPANHSYFNLNSGNNILDQYLSIDADYYLALDENNIPFKKAQKVKESVFDFRNPTLIGKAIRSNDPQIKSQLGLNHPFLLNKNGKIDATLESLDHQRRLELSTTAPSIVVYTGNHFNHRGYTKNIGQYAGVALETQVPPSQDEQLREITLLPDERFYRRTSWHIDF